MTPIGAGLKRGIISVFGRAVTLRCPRCGARGVLETWFRLRPACSVCALPFGHPEEEDYWFGPSLFNIIAAELFTAAAIAVMVVATFPRVPWTVVETTGIVLAIATPFAFYPFARLLWVGLDYMLGER